MEHSIFKTKLFENNKYVYLVMFSRILLIALAQVFGFLLCMFFGSKEPWRLSADWWVFNLIFINIVCLFLIAYLMKKEGKKLRSLWKISEKKEERKKDIKWSLIALIISAPLALIPNVLLGTILWGNAIIGSELMFREIPLQIAILILILFPITQGLAELTLYFGYVMPRIKQKAINNIWPLVICASVLSLQHAFLPFLLDWRFILWRSFMFLPFAFWLGYVIKKRPTSLPILMVAHGILDLSVPIMILLASIK